LRVAGSEKTLQDENIHKVMANVDLDLTSYEDLGNVLLNLFLGFRFEIQKLFNFQFWSSFPSLFSCYLELKQFLD